VHALLEDQNALLAKGRNDWMRQGKLQLGGAYRDVMQRIARTHLLGPETVEQLQGQSGASFVEFRRQFALAFGNHGAPGVVWRESDHRFGLSEERAALRLGLGALLKTSFMAEAAPAARKDTRDSGTLPKALQEARALAAERAKAVTEVLPLFPAARPAGGGARDRRPRVRADLPARLPLAQGRPAAGCARAVRRRGLPPAARAGAGLQAVLKETGGAGLGDRLVATLDGELLRAWPILQEDWRQPAAGGRARERLQLVAGRAAAAGAAWAPRSRARRTPLPSAARRPAWTCCAAGAPLLALGSPAWRTTRPPRAGCSCRRNWQRYAARASDSSLLRLERYVAALGPDLRRENCAERLAAQPARGDGDDESRSAIASCTRRSRSAATELRRCRTHRGARSRSRQRPVRPPQPRLHRRDGAGARAVLPSAACCPAGATRP
jgi:type VI secretion system protein ImpL